MENIQMRHIKFNIIVQFQFLVAHISAHSQAFTCCSTVTIVGRQIAPDSHQICVRSVVLRLRPLKLARIRTTRRREWCDWGVPPWWCAPPHCWAVKPETCCLLAGLCSLCRFVVVEKLKTVFYFESLQMCSVQTDVHPDGADSDLVWLSQQLIWIHPCMLQRHTLHSQRFNRSVTFSFPRHISDTWPYGANAFLLHFPVFDTLFDDEEMCHITVFQVCRTKVLQ